MPIYSYSRIKTYQTCPYKYKLQYIDKIEIEEEGIEAFMGSRVHETLEKLYTDLAGRKNVTLEGLLEYYHKIWTDKWHDKVIIVKKGQTADDYKAIGEKAIIGYFEEYQPFDQNKVLCIEKKKIFDLGDSSYKMIAILDRLDERSDGTLEIHDYKTSGRLPMQKQIETDKQLALYQLAVLAEYPDRENIELVWHYLKFNVEFRSSRTQEQLKDLKKEYRDHINELESVKEFPTKDSPLCNWCGYQKYCPAKRRFVSLDDF